jgi:hypothetical protein
LAPRLQPWYKVIAPREELRSPGAHLDAGALVGDVGEGADLATVARRLFAWHDLPGEGRHTAHAYQEWLDAQGLAEPGQSDGLLATYPLHPAVPALLDGPWRQQSARGAVLRLLALWIARAYAGGVRRAQRDPLIGLGSAPLEDPDFQEAQFDLFGRRDLGAAIVADIAGAGSHAARLDRQAPEDLRAARLHRKVATALFLRSLARLEPDGSTLPQIAVAVAEPDLTVAQIGAALEALAGVCYYLLVEDGRYRFDSTLKLDALLADRRGGVESREVEARARSAVREAFEAGPRWAERIIFPTAGQDVPDRPALTMVVLGPEQAYTDPARGATLRFVDRVLREHGAAGRVFRGALLFLAPTDPGLHEAARTLLAWEGLAHGDTPILIHDAQRSRIETAVRDALAALRTAIGDSYRWVVLLGADNIVQTLDLGPLGHDPARSLGERIRDALLARGAVAAAIDPACLLPYWPPHREWPTRAVRDAFYAMPALPRPLEADVILRAIARGVAAGLLGYVVRDDEEGQPVQVCVDTEPALQDLRFGSDTVIVRAADARALGASAARDQDAGDDAGPAPPSARLRWEGTVPWPAYTRLGTDVISRIAAIPGLTIRVRFDVPAADLSDEDLQQLLAALLALGLDDGALR